MGGRNNKLCDQKGQDQDPEGVTQAKKPPKKSCRGSKGPFQVCMAGKKLKLKLGFFLPVMLHLYHSVESCVH